MHLHQLTEERTARATSALKQFDMKNNIKRIRKLRESMRRWIESIRVRVGGPDKGGKVDNIKPCCHTLADAAVCMTGPRAKQINQDV